MQQIDYHIVFLPRIRTVAYKTTIPIGNKINGETPIEAGIVPTTTAINPVVNA
jgi:hypothetical protein